MKRVEVNTALYKAIIVPVLRHYLLKTVALERLKATDEMTELLMDVDPLPKDVFPIVVEATVIRIKSGLRAFSLRTPHFQTIASEIYCH